MKLNTINVKKYWKTILTVLIAVILVLFIGIDIYHRSLGNVDNQEEELKELLQNKVKEYQKIIEKDIKYSEEEQVYIINDGNIVKRNIKTHEQLDVTNIEDKNDYGILLAKDQRRIYYIQSNGYCISQIDKNESLKIKKGICKSISNENTLADAIQKYSTNDELVADTTETGLDANKPYTSKLYFKGENPNNYLIYENYCYRIMNITQNNSVKIIYEGPANNEGNCNGVATNVSGYVALLAWDNEKTTDTYWDTPAYLSFRMSDWVDMGEIDMKSFKITIDQSKLQLADWYTGMLTSNDSLNGDINDERSRTYQTYIGLINPSDYNKISCETSANDNNVTCKEDNYLYKDKYGWWTINRAEGKDKSAWSIDITGIPVRSTVPFSNEYSYKGIRPVFYLKGDSFVKGIGSNYAPYVIS